MMKTILTILIVAITAGPAAAQCGLVKFVLKRRLAGLEHRAESVAARLGEGGGSRMDSGGGGYNYQESYQPTQAIQMQAVPVNTGYQYQQSFQQNYGSQGVQALGAYSQYQALAPMATQQAYQTQAAPASTQTFQGPPVTQQHVETITQPAPVVTQSVAPQPAIVTRQSYGSQGSAVTTVPQPPAGFQSVLQPFTYGSQGK